MDKNDFKSDFSTLEKTRRAAILTAANLLEAADKAKRLRKRFVASMGLEDDNPAKDDKKDFLFDLLRLNANYMNQLASLGKKHGSIAHSALEKLYTLMVPPGRADATGELSFSRTRRIAHFRIRNESAVDVETATIEVRGIVPSSRDPGGRWLKSLRTLSNDQPVAALDATKRRYEVRVAFGQTLDLGIKIYGEFTGHRHYSAEVAITLGDRVRTIPVHIDWRDPSKRSS